MTPEELDEMELLWKQRMPIKKIAEKLRYCISTIRITAMMHRDRFPYRRVQVPQDKKDLWVTRIMAGRAKVDDVARILGVHPTTVRNWLKTASKKGQ